MSIDIGEPAASMNACWFRRLVCYREHYERWVGEEAPTDDDLRQLWGLLHDERWEAPDLAARLSSKYVQINKYNVYACRKNQCNACQLDGGDPLKAL